jgi:hypothetical protein
LIRRFNAIHEQLPDASVTGRASGSRSCHSHDAPYRRLLQIADGFANVVGRELQAMADIAALRESGTAAFAEFTGSFRLKHQRHESVPMNG